MITRRPHGLLILLVALSLGTADKAFAQALDESLSSIEKRLVVAAYEATGREQGKAMKKLLVDVRSLHQNHPDRPEAAAWHGIVAQTFMDVSGSSGLAREARDALLKAENLDPLILEGQVYARLGALYSDAPSRFGGFGSKSRGIGYLWKAISVDPNGIDSNYLYAELLVKERDYRAARDALLKVSKAPLRENHRDIDRARKADAERLLAQVQIKLQELG